MPRPNCCRPITFLYSSVVNGVSSIPTQIKSNIVFTGPVAATAATAAYQIYQSDFIPSYVIRGISPLVVGYVVKKGQEFIPGPVTASQASFQRSSTKLLKWVQSRWIARGISEEESPTVTAASTAGAAACAVISINICLTYISPVTMAWTAAAAAAVGTYSKYILPANSRNLGLAANSENFSLPLDEKAEQLSTRGVSQPLSKKGEKYYGRLTSISWLLGTSQDHTSDVTNLNNKHANIFSQEHNSVTLGQKEAYIQELFKLYQNEIKNFDYCKVATETRTENSKEIIVKLIQSWAKSPAEWLKRWATAYSVLNFFGSTEDQIISPVINLINAGLQAERINKIKEGLQTLGKVFGFSAIFKEYCEVRRNPSELMFLVLLILVTASLIAATASILPAVLATTAGVVTITALMILASAWFVNGFLFLKNEALQMKRGNKTNNHMYAFFQPQGIQKKYVPTDEIKKSAENLRLVYITSIQECKASIKEYQNLPNQIPPGKEISDYEAHKLLLDSLESSWKMIHGDGAQYSIEQASPSLTKETALQLIQIDLMKLARRKKKALEDEIKETLTNALEEKLSETSAPRIIDNKKILRLKTELLAICKAHHDLSSEAVRERAERAERARGPAATAVKDLVIFSSSHSNSDDKHEHEHKREDERSRSRSRSLSR